MPGPEGQNTNEVAEKKQAENKFVETFRNFEDAITRYDQHDGTMTEWSQNNDEEKALDTKTKDELYDMLESLQSNLDSLSADTIRNMESQLYQLTTDAMSGESRADIRTGLQSIGSQANARGGEINGNIAATEGAITRRQEKLDDALRGKFD